MARERNFEELMAPAAVAEKLSISVATLRKYSLIIEKVSGNPDYYQRTKQKARLYRKRDVEDLQDFKKVAQKEDLTLQEADQQIFAGSSADTPAPVDTEAKNATASAVDATQVVELLKALQQTITAQNQAIADLKQRVSQIQAQNTQLLAQSHEQPSKELSQPETLKKKPLTLTDSTAAGMTREKQRQKVAAEIEADRHKSDQEVRREILNKAVENAKKKAQQNVHRTLADMQLPETKKHWWQRFFK